MGFLQEPHSGPFLVPAQENAPRGGREAQRRTVSELSGGSVGEVPTKSAPVGSNPTVSAPIHRTKESLLTGVSLFGAHPTNQHLPWEKKGG